MLSANWHWHTLVWTVTGTDMLPWCVTESTHRVRSVLKVSWFQILRFGTTKMTAIPMTACHAGVSSRLGHQVLLAQHIPQATEQAAQPKQVSGWNDPLQIFAEPQDRSPSMFQTPPFSLTVSHLPTALTVTQVTGDSGLVSWGGTFIFGSRKLTPERGSPRACQAQIQKPAGSEAQYQAEGENRATQRYPCR